MGEVLRAIMDHNCLDARPAFYSAQLTQVLTVAGPFTIARRRARITCKADTYFLMLGATQDSGFWVTPPAAPNYVFETVAFPSTYQIVRANTGEAFSIRPQVQTNLNNDLNNFVTLDEYPLFEPAELIEINEDVRTGAGVPLTAYAFVTLAGIEYQMPGNRR